MYRNWIAPFMSPVTAEFLGVNFPYRLKNKSWSWFPTKTVVRSISLVLSYTLKKKSKKLIYFDMATDAFT